MIDVDRAGIRPASLLDLIATREPIEDDLDGFVDHPPEPVEL